MADLENIIAVHSLGTIGEVGDVYDASSDKVIKRKLFTKYDVMPCKTILPSTFPTIEKIDSEKEMTENYSAMNINPQLQISMLCESTENTPFLNIAELDSWVGFYIEKRSSEKSVDPSEIPCLECEEEPSATHVIVGVCYGGYSFILLQWRDTRKTSNREDIEAAALAEIKSRLSICEVFAPERGKQIDEVFKVFIGVSTDNAIYQKSFDDACSTILDAKNEDHPVEYKLLPLKSSNSNHHYHKLDNLVRNKAITILTKTVHYKLILNHLSKSLKSDEYSILFDEIALSVQKLAAIILQARRKPCYKTDLEKMLGNFEERFQGTKSALNSDLIKACKVYRNLSLKDYFLSKGYNLMSYKQFKALCTDFKVHVLFADTNKIDVDEDKNVALLERLRKGEKKPTDFFIVDNKDVLDGEGAKLKNKCHTFIFGKVLQCDLLATIGKDLDISLISGPAQKLVKHPNVSVQAVFKCPSPNCVENDDELWMCSSCSTNQIRYSSVIRSFFCLICKLSIPIEKATYRCSNVSHGVNFEVGSDKSKAAINTLKESEEKNILIVGETGVGKSTWINGIRNYMEFENLNDAVKNGGPIALIPSAFTFTNKVGKSHVISVGETKDSNERNDVGKSCTKHPQSYTFTRDNGQVINLIDTPGLCDTEHVDDENFNNILKHIKRYECIHAICILLKPNNARLTVIFRYCINELLTHFHKGAVDNIVFCFTNSRSTFYCPGDTLPPLQKLLKEHNLNILDSEDARKERMFCFDNEAFRFLAILKNGIEMSSDQFKDYSNSWIQSVDETNRLFNKILNLKGHKTKQTIDINQARDLILRMAKPLAEITQAINKSISAIKEAEHKGELIDDTAKDLKNKLHFKGIDLSRKNLDLPRTVCTHANCIKRKTVGKNQEQVIVYTQHCHPECYLKGISPETINDHRLVDCWAITSSTGICHQCNHHYTMHKHITYEVVEETKNFMSDDINKEIMKKQTLQEQNQEFIRQKNILIKELNMEHDKVIDASAKFACFLKKSAILYYNDAVEDYLKHLLNEEQNKDRHLQNSSQISKIQNTKEAYVKKRKMLDIALKKDIVVDGIDFSDPDIVIKLQKELYSLKHYGVTLKRIIEDGQNFLVETSKFVRIIVPSKPKPTTKKKGFWSLFSDDGEADVYYDSYQNQPYGSARNNWYGNYGNPVQQNRLGYGNYGGVVTNSNRRAGYGSPSPMYQNRNFGRATTNWRGNYGNPV